MRCSYATMDWYCCLPAGHEGAHESETLLPESEFRTPTNPSSASPLDVEACVRLLDDERARHEAAARAFHELVRPETSFGPGLEAQCAYRIAKHHEDSAATLSRLRVFLSDELPELIAALRRIANPVTALQADADAQGARLDGMAAMALSRDATYLSCVAQRALDAARSLPTEPTDSTPNSGAPSSSVGVPGETTEESKNGQA